MRTTALVLLLSAVAVGCGEPKTSGRTGSKVGTKAGHADSGLPPPTKENLNPHANAGPTSIWFEDHSTASRIDAVNHSGRAGVKEYLLEAVGTGPTWFDYDGDGLLDIHVPDGDVFSNYVLSRRPDPTTGRPVVLMVPKTPRPEPIRDQLWRNRGDGTFEDVAVQAGVADENWSFGATAFDYDADGWTDLFVCNFGPCRLFRNNGDGTFTDVAEQAGLQGPPGRWATSASIGDYDGDGRLDIHVAGFSDPAAEIERQRIERGLPPDVPVETISGRSCRWKGIRAYCGPLGLVGQQDALYRQREDGTFVDVSPEAGMRLREPKYGFTTVFFDLNDDGLPDIYVANDSVENLLWMQERDAQGKIRFRDVADTLGVKYGQQLNAQASMGCTMADINQDGLWDLFVTNFSHDYNNIFLGHRVKGSAGGFYFRDRGLQIMGQAVYYDLAWGCGWMDFDNDADLDLYVANGHVYKEIDLFEKTGTQYEQYNAIFECIDAPKSAYREIGPKAHVPEGVNPADLEAGPGARVKQCSRGACFGDWDNDGRTDILVQNMNEKPNLVRNGSRGDGAWVKIVLQQPGGNRDAIGATVEVTAGGRKQWFPVFRGSSFLGCDDPRVNVGLGKARTCDVRVTWPPTGLPGGERTTTEFKGLEAGGFYRLDRATGQAERQPLPAVRLGG